MGEVILEVRLADPTEQENIRTFRNLTNRVVGRGLQIPENNLLFIAHRISHNGAIDLIVGAGSCRPAGFVSSVIEGVNPDLFICDGSSHVIEYIFIDQYYQQDGYGFKLLDAMEKHLLHLNPISELRLYSAHKSRGFFLHCGYRYYHGDQNTTRTTNSSVMLFKSLHPMIRKPEWPRHNLTVKAAASGSNSGRRNRKSGGWSRRGTQSEVRRPLVGPG